MDRVSAHDLRRAFARESVPHQVTVASAQGGEATNPGVAADSSGGGRPESLALLAGVGVQQPPSQLTGSRNAGRLSGCADVAAARYAPEPRLDDSGSF
jgi:hypothetical protein